MRLPLKQYRGPDEARRASYPAIGDQLDAVMKMGAALRDQGVTFPSEVNKWIDQCQAVKDRIPKQQ